MTDTRLKLLVAEAITLDREIRRLGDKLKGLKADLVHEAESRPEGQTPTDGGGFSWAAEADDGSIARVTFGCPTLKSSIPGVGKTIEKVMQAAGSHFTRLFQQTPAWKPVEGFREAAEQLLGAKDGRKLIKLVTTETAPRVSFETKPEATE